MLQKRATENDPFSSDRVQAKYNSEQKAIEDVRGIDRVREHDGFSEYISKLISSIIFEGYMYRWPLIDGADIFVLLCRSAVREPSGI